MLFADLSLARRLERAEGYASAQFAAARRQACEDSKAEWTEIGGAYAVYDGADSPVTQCFGLGLSQPLDAAVLDTIEQFFLNHQGPPTHEVSPFAGVAGIQLLCQRGYRPIELSSVLYRTIEVDQGERPPGPISVRVISAHEAALWTATNALGWGQDHPELLKFLMNFGKIAVAREGTVCFLGAFEGVPGAAGALCISEGVALFAGASTLPELRRRGLQSALLAERLRYAQDHGCDLAMMVTEVGSGSQRNAERNGFRVAYTRTKWQLRNGS